MKKVLGLLLVIAVCLSFVACGGNLKEKVVGDWTGDFVYNAETWEGSQGGAMCLAAGHSATSTLRVFKGGVAQLNVRSNTTGFDFNLNGTWEINDGILVYSDGEALILSFEIDTGTTPNTLFLQGSSMLCPDTLIKK